MSYMTRIVLMFFCISLSSLLFINTDCMATQLSDGVYTITTDLIGSSGGSAADSGYQLQASIGQPAQGTVSALAHIIRAGFLFAAKPIAKPKSNIFLLIIPAITSQAGP